MGPRSWPLGWKPGRKGFEYKDEVEANGPVVSASLAKGVSSARKAEPPASCRAF